MSAFSRIKQGVIARTGHAYYADKDDALRERLDRRLAATRLDEAGYAALLEAGDEAEWRALEAEITIGETFFFRYGEQFTALRDVILPDLLRRREATRRLRIWSAGCSNGAEPYSLAILLRRLLGPAFASWRISILGTDINETALGQARRAQFSNWALRTLDGTEREQDFRPLPGGRHWQLRPEHRGLVRFERHNLLDLLDGGTAPGEAALDLILCRNVLIYFSAAQVLALVRGLGGCLVEDGWMLLGHSEPNLAFAAFLDPVALPGTVAYRPRTAPPVVPAVSTPAWQPADLPIPARAAPGLVPAPGTGADAASGRQDRLAPTADVAADLVTRLRALADAGDSEAAIALAEAALAAPGLADPQRATLLFYKSLLLPDRTQAVDGLRRCVSLYNGFVMAHYQLGMLLLQDGRPGEGRRALVQAARLARLLPPDASLAEGDGLTAAELDRLVSHTLARPAP